MKTSPNRNRPCTRARRLKPIGFVLIGVAAFVVAWPGRARAAVKVGDRAPNFTLTGADGLSHALKSKEYRDRVVVLEWYNKDCPFVRKFYDAKRMQEWQAQATTGPEPVAWLTITSGASGERGFLTPEEAARLRTETGMNNTALLLDSRGVVGRLYGATATPQVFIINRQGRIAFAGAVDDRPSARPESLAGAQNYLVEALTAVRADRAVNKKTSSPAPYGCGIKY